MKKLLIGFVVLAVLVIGIFFLLQREAETKVEREVVPFPEPPAGAIVFDMEYRGLGGGKDEMRYGSYMGYGGRRDYEPRFIKALKKKVEGLHTIYNPEFGKAQYSAVEVKDGNAVALYFDLNGDSKVSDNEKIPPVNVEKYDDMKSIEFVTPDFVMNKGDGRKVPFRVLLRVSFFGESEQPSCMWSPSGVLEGTSNVDGEQTKLILFTSGFEGKFNKFGWCSYALVGSEEETGKYIPRSKLSSIINHDGKFYNLKLYGSHEEGRTVRAMLENYTGDIGELAVQLTGNTSLKANLNSAGIVGSKDGTICFRISSGQAELPTGAYKLSSGRIKYGAETDDQWQLSFREGPEVAIKADETSNVEFGKPVLSIMAVDEKKRYNSDVKEQKVYSKGTNVYITRVIKGRGGETYGRFSQRQEDSSTRYTDIEPEIRIVDAKGKEVAATKIEYG